MFNGKIGLTAILIVFCTILAAVGCFFSMNGTGNYVYEASAGDSIGVVHEEPLLAVVIVEIFNYGGPFVDEDLDDEFDLLDDGELDSWIWFSRIEVYVSKDHEGVLHYGTC